MNTKPQQPTINLPGVTVFFPVNIDNQVASMAAADAFLADHGVPEEARWVVPQLSASGKPQLVFHGGR